MKNRIFQNNEGISPVLGFILILAIGVTLLTTVQLSFVPVWNTQEELEHIKLMQDDFKVLKSNIESGIQSGTTLSSPLIMGFKYSPKMLVYNPRDEAYASLEISNNTWVEVRYNEVFPEGMTDETSIKNISTGMITYVLRGAQNYNSFIYENGLIRRSGSDYTTNSQTVLANNTIFIPSVKALDYGTLSGVEKRTINIYPTSQQKNSVIGKNVWLILHTDPVYVDWWENSLENEGAYVRKKDRTNGIVIANISSSLVIKMGEAYISASQKTSPPHSRATRIVRVSGTGNSLPVGGTNSITVEVQDEYNNPVPNVLVSFSINASSTGHPSNSYSNATISPGSAVSGSDGRASVTLTANDAGFYYIDASMTDYKTTIVYSASSQGSVMKLDSTLSGSDYIITATLKNSLGSPVTPGTNVDFETSDGILSDYSKTTISDGTANTTLNVSGATGIKITNIQVKNTTSNTTNITWNTNNNITVTAKSGYVFNSKDVPTDVITTGCVMYGTSSRVYSFTPVCDAITSSHSVSLSGLSADTAYYFIVNGSRPGKGSVNSTEYMFVTGKIADDGVPPSSITGLGNIPGALSINWTWIDPLDVDFDYVQIYIDGVPNGTRSKGVQYFNAYYFLPGTTHTISTRTVDSTGRMNETWVNDSVTTTSLFTYVYGFNDTTGLTTSPDYAKNATDGLYAVLSEEPVGGSNLSDRPTNPIKTITNGTQGGGSYTPSNLTDSDGAIDITIPDVASTAHIFDTSAVRYTTTTAWGTVNPNTLSYTAGTGSSVMVLGIVTAGTAYRTAGTPTFNGKSFTSIGRNMAAAPEGSAELWYLLLDPSDTGSAYTVSVPNAATSRAFNFYVATFKSSTGVSALDAFANSSGMTANPNHSVTTTVNGDAIVSVLFSGAGTSTGAINYGGIQLYVNDPGAYFGKLGYKINASTGTNFSGWTVAADDFALLTAAFKVVPNYYSLNITYNFTETNPNSTWQSISIQDSSYGDPLTNVSIFNKVSGLWESLSPSGFSGGTTPAQHVNTVVGASGNASDYDAGSGQIKIKYNWTGSTQNNSLGVDLINVTVNYAAGGLYRLNITSNTTGIPNSTNHELQIKYYVSGDNFTMQVWNGAAFVNKTTLNKTSPDYYNYTLLPGELQFDGSTTGGTVGNIDQYYVLVRYVDLTPNSVQGNLYLDYQRVYSW